MTYGKCNKKRKIIWAIFGLILLFILCFLVLKFMYSMQNTTLQSTWRSEETGQVLTFNENNQVKLEGHLPDGIYHILSPNTMEYTTDGKTFRMVYHIEDNKLYWGIDENHLECFEKVWY